jgi:hypothetical protein
MEPRKPSSNGAPSSAGPGNHPLWWLAFLALVAAQAWMTLGLFSRDHTTDRLFDETPILSGRHPLHLYHGFLGARSWLSRETPSCYDPTFQAGYPKTPVFDDGSRPAEALLALTGGQYRPCIYKWGLFGLCIAAPCVFAGAARGAGMSRFRACLACGLGMLVWWGRPCRDLIEAGDIDLLSAALAVLAETGLLLRYHRAPGPLSLLGVALTAFLGWYCHPLLMAVAAPLVLIYFFTVGARHHLLWHTCLAAAIAAPVAANLFWLQDWIDYWWLRTPLNLEAPTLTSRTLPALWAATIWGEPADRTLACFLAGAAVIGVALLHGGGRRPAARMFGVGAIGGLLMAAVAIVWGSLGRFGAERLFAPALMFAAVPAAHAITRALRPVRRLGGWGSAFVVGGAALAGLTVALPSHREAWLSRWRDNEPLQIGLNAERLNVVAALAEKTTNEARILWEDRRGTRQSSHWTALLSHLTGRAFVGGLDPEAAIEHTAGGLIDQTLAGRPLDDWKDVELRHYCDHYNIGWVVCWSEKAVQRFERWEDVTETTADLQDGGAGKLFTLKRKPTFALHGSARWQSADANRIVLADVKPQDGNVVLSVHFQAGMRVAPSRVKIRRHIDADDPIAFVLLELDEPAPVVTITWDKP